MGLDRFGEKSADRLIRGIEDSKNVPFERVLYALSIPQVGETTAKKIARRVGDIDTLMQMSEPELCAIDDVGAIIAKGIIEYFDAPANQEIIARLKAAGLQFAVDTVEAAESSDALAGKTIVISGVFSKHSRDEYKDMIERAGGKNSGSISKKTSFVLAGENMGPAKLEKAHSLGIPVIDENTFLQMLQPQE